jgi:RNA polymerase sigma-70 factor (ECF subfamily)
VYLTAQEKRPPDLVYEDLRRWLIRVTVNRCRLEHRRTGRWRKAFGGLTRIFDRHRQNGSVAESVERDEERTQIRQALHLLDTDARTLLVLRYFAEFDSTEIGRILNVNEATVRGRLRNARQKLAEELRRTGYK